MKLSPPDPRDYLPSRAHPEHRKQRKQLEKEHPFGVKEFAVLGLIGLTLAWDIEKQVQEREARKDKEEAERNQPQRRRRRGDGDDRKDRRGRSAHASSTTSDDSRRDHYNNNYTGANGSGSGSGNSATHYSRDPRRRHQSVDYRAPAQRYDDDRYYGYVDRRYYDKDPRDYRQYDGRYDYGDFGDHDRAERGRSRRDSW